MAMWKCPKCGIELCDVDIYYGIDKKRNLNMRIKCPNCREITRLREWRY